MRKGFKTFFLFFLKCSHPLFPFPKTIRRKKRTPKAITIIRLTPRPEQITLHHYNSMEINMCALLLES
ncbi:hypothetical protein ES288_A06G107800v1 [Gossypium darwinii]|uniref:Uncharacterized protein n=1 Tax=Gossypium darwinii TaxID=34276 RepID=A0A5D2G5F9_GOSDA|nr:hypothetical protein ES288_A06G107800v1 [Gossypium darwinii]